MCLQFLVPSGCKSSKVVVLLKINTFKAGIILNLGLSLDRSPVSLVQALAYMCIHYTRIMVAAMILVSKFAVGNGLPSRSDPSDSTVTCTLLHGMEGVVVI